MILVSRMRLPLSAEGKTNDAVRMHLRTAATKQQINMKLTHKIQNNEIKLLVKLEGDCATNARVRRETNEPVWALENQLITQLKQFKRNEHLQSCYTYPLVNNYFHYLFLGFTRKV
jgi:hypothetical protein